MSVFWIVVITLIASWFINAALWGLAMWLVAGTVRDAASQSKEK